MPCPCERLKHYQTLSEEKRLYTIPLAIGTTVYVINYYSRHDWHVQYYIEERTVEVYLIREKGITEPCYCRSGRFDPVRGMGGKYFTDRAEAEKELERIKRECVKGSGANTNTFD